MQNKKKPLRDKLTTHGGNRGYAMTVSKIAKRRNEDGKLEGKVITVDRERMLQKIGHDVGPNIVAMHLKGGSHFSDKGEPFKMGTRAENTSDSNKARAKKFKDKFKS